MRADVRSGVPRVGWVTDVQNDFMCPPEAGGRLYVRDLSDAADPGAEQVRAAIERAVAWMREHCAAMVYTTDWHSLEDDEIDAENPDPASGTYPPHCMGLSTDLDLLEGAAILSSIRPQEPLVLEREADPATAGIIATRAVRDGRPVVIRKNRFDVFAGNPAAEAFVLALVEELGGAVEFVVVGVARDVCVTQAIDGLQARGLPTVGVRDATWGLGLEPEEVTLARWSEGGRVVTLEELTSES
ncbi:MAG: cysteine hydrolase family protein [Gemmatimonadota bacterium]